MTARLGTRWRLAILAALAVAPALVLADVVVVGSLTAAAAAEVDNSLVAQAALLQGSINDSNGHVTFGPGGGGTGPLTVTGSIVTGGVVTATSGRDPIAGAALAPLASRAERPGATAFADISDSHGDAQRGYAVSLASGEAGAPAPVLVVTRSVSAFQATQRRTAILAAALSLVTLVLTGLIARWLAGRVLRPVRTIARVARGISERDIHQRVDIRVPADEFGELVATFNDMLERLEHDFESLRRFTADASHELRAPLSIMRGELEVSLARERSGVEYRRSQRLLLGEVLHLGQITDRLLVLARSDAGTLRLERSAIDVNDLLTETVNRWQPQGNSRGVGLAADCSDSAAATGDAALVREVLDNLVGNALRHAPPGTIVRLTATGSAAGWTIEVADQGPGVPMALRSRLFDRFFRGEEARTHGGEAGVGLGLAVSSAIARAHGGELTYVDTAGGAVFRLFLPGHS